MYNFVYVVLLFFGGRLMSWLHTFNAILFQNGAGGGVGQLMNKQALDRVYTVLETDELYLFRMHMT